MTPDVPSLIPGEVVELADCGARVRLDDGRRGILPKAAPELRVGSRSTFSIERSREDGELVLSIALPSVAEMPPHSFDREFDRLHDALANHSPQSIRPRVHTDALGEKRIEEWMERVNETVAHLRKRRAKRLSDQT